jgi:hypothetical protein
MWTHTNATTKPHNLQSGHLSKLLMHTSTLSELAKFVEENKDQLGPAHLANVAKKLEGMVRFVLNIKRTLLSLLLWVQGRAFFPSGVYPMALSRPCTYLSTNKQCYGPAHCWALTTATSWPRTSHGTDPAFLKHGVTLHKLCRNQQSHGNNQQNPCLACDTSEVPMCLQNGLESLRVARMSVHKHTSVCTRTHADTIVDTHIYMETRTCMHTSMQTAPVLAQLTWIRTSQTQLHVCLTNTYTHNHTYTNN